MTITAHKEDGSTVRLSLPKPLWTGRQEIGTGLFRTAIYVSPRAQRCVVEFDSIWQDQRANDGSCVGTTYSLVTDPEVLNHLADVDDDVAAALEKVGLVTVEAL